MPTEFIIRKVIDTIRAAIKVITLTRTIDFLRLIVMPIPNLRIALSNIFVFIVDHLQEYFFERFLRFVYRNYQNA